MARFLISTKPAEGHVNPVLPDLAHGRLEGLQGQGVVVRVEAVLVALLAERGAVAEAIAVLRQLQ